AGAGGAEGAGVQHHAGVAVGALEHPPAGARGAADVGGVAAAVEEKDRLPAGFDRLGEGAAERRADRLEGGAVARVPGLGPGGRVAALQEPVDDLDARELAAADA